MAKLLIIILIVCCVFVSSIGLFIVTNKTVTPKPPTVTFTVVNNANSYALRYRISNSTINGWSPFKMSFLDKIYGRVLAPKSLSSKLSTKTITISKEGSIYFYNSGWRYKFGGGLQINGKDITDNSTIYINAELDIISLSGGKVYIDS